MDFEKLSLGFETSHMTSQGLGESLETGAAKRICLGASSVSISLQDNPWICNCQLQAIRNWILRTMITKKLVSQSRINGLQKSYPNAQIGKDCRAVILFI